MTKVQIAQFLGFPGCYRVAPRLLEGMADTIAPDPEHDLSDRPTLEAFLDFCRCAGPPGARGDLLAQPTLLGGRLEG